jgi:hypothetical protein
MPARQGIKGYNQDLFKLGTQFAQEPDDDPNGNVWDQPFQSPYGGGAGGFSPQMGQDPQIPQGGIPYPTGPNSWDQMQPMPEQQGPPPSPKKDMNHPFWSSVGQFLGSDAFKDSVMAGVIYGQMASDPKGALQMAVQFKEQRERRKWEAQQNQMQREAVAANIKERSEVTKENKAQTDLARRVAKIQAGLQVGNVPPEAVQQWIAENGPPGAENIDKAETDFAILQSQQKAKARQLKEETSTLNSKLKVLGDIHSGRPIKDESLPPNLSKDPAFLAATAEARKNAAALADFDKRLKAARLDLVTKNIKAQDPELKVRLAIAMKKLDDVFITRRGVEASLRNAQKPNPSIFQAPQEEVENFVSGLNNNITDLDAELESALAELGGIAQAKGEGNPAPEAPAKKTMSAQEKARRQKLGLPIEE